MSTIIVTETCPYCAQARSIRDMIRFSAFRLCQDCYGRHLKALEALSSGKYTGECSECGKSVEEIRLLQGEGDNGVRMAIHFENGIYRPMCLRCDGVYVPKRADLYGETEFWRRGEAGLR